MLVGQKPTLKEFVKSKKRKDRAKRIFQRVKIKTECSRSIYQVRYGDGPDTRFSR